MKSIEKRPTEKSLDEGEGATLLQQKEKTSWMKPELKSWLFKKRRLFIAVLKRRPRVVLALLGALIAGIAVLVGLQLVASASPYTAQDIGDLGDDSSGGAYGMNNSGQVVGYSYNASGRPHAFLYDSLNGMQDLGTLGGSDDYSYAYGINDFGQVVGYSQNTNGESHAFLWDREHGMQDLGTLDGGRGSNAFDINNSGQVVGYAFVDGQSRAVLWDQANGIQELGNLGGGYGHFDAYNEHAASINDSGQVVGQSHNASGQSHAFLWDQEHGMQDLGTLGGHIGSNAWDVNNSGQVVGKSYDNIGIERFFLWDQANGMQDLVHDQAASSGIDRCS
jgi:probable HAF family extracellular repeat protein